MILRLQQLRRFRAAQEGPRIGMFLGTAGGAGGADEGGVDEPQVAAQAPVPLEVVEQRGEDLGPGAVATPAVEPVGDGLPGSIAFREITPGGAGVEDPEDAVEQVAMGLPGMSLAPVVGGMGQEVLEPFPLTVVELITTTQGWPPVGNRPSREVGLPLL
jgi:hypothetical protein